MRGWPAPNTNKAGRLVQLRQGCSFWMTLFCSWFQNVQHLSLFSFSMIYSAHLFVHVLSLPSPSVSPPSLSPLLIFSLLSVSFLPPPPPVFSPPLSISPLLFPFSSLFLPFFSPLLSFSIYIFSEIFYLFSLLSIFPFPSCLSSFCLLFPSIFSPLSVSPFISPPVLSSRPPLLSSQPRLSFSPPVFSCTLSLLSLFSISLLHSLLSSPVLFPSQLLPATFSLLYVFFFSPPVSLVFLSFISSAIFFPLSLSRWSPTLPSLPSSLLSSRVPIPSLSTNLIPSVFSSSLLSSSRVIFYLLSPVFSPSVSP